MKTAKEKSGEETKVNKIIQGDCLEKLKELKDNSVDSIITDPPYHLVSIVKRFGKEGSAPAKEGTDGSFKRLSGGFMGKTWDGLGEDGIGITNNPLMWKECLRVLKPGGHLLSFSGTRTYHRMVVAIEDAGFEIRDMINWCYGSGFPKSLNIGKAVDKINGELGRKQKFTEWMRTTGVKASEANKLLQEAKIISENETMAGHFFAKDKGGQPAIPTAEIWEILRPHIKIEIPQWVDELVERIEREREVVGKDEAGFLEKNNVFEMGNKGYGSFDLTKGTSEWEGWGTALKPAHEPICMARKPLAENSVAENVLKWGTGGINIDESRVGTGEDKIKGGCKVSKNANAWNKNRNQKTQDDKKKEIYSQGRFPANLIHDNSEEVRECFPNESERFFKSIIYQPKASKSERNRGCEGLEEKANSGSYEFRTDGSLDGKPTAPKSNFHPTVKPIALMEYLIKMITSKGGVVLDPFAGSGTTLVAAKQNGFKYIGIELTEDYIPIINARLNATEQIRKIEEWLN